MEGKQAETEIQVMWLKLGKYTDRKYNQRPPDKENGNLL